MHFFGIPPRLEAVMHWTILLMIGHPIFGYLGVLMYENLDNGKGTKAERAFFTFVTGYVTFLLVAPYFVDKLLSILLGDYTPEGSIRIDDVWYDVVEMDP